jgi:hypothetical protein
LQVKVELVYVSYILSRMMLHQKAPTIKTSTSVIWSFLRVYAAIQDRAYAWAAAWMCC